MTVWVYVNTSKQVGDIDHLKIFASEDAANHWFAEHDHEGVAFKYEVIGTQALLSEGQEMQPALVQWHSVSAGNNRHFESVENAVKFVMEKLGVADRATAWIVTDDHTIRIEDIECMYAGMNAAGSQGNGPCA
jgi:hypothetical protein